MNYSLLGNALIEHYRCWIAEDGIEMKRIKQNQGQMNQYSLRRIAIIYRVNRGIVRLDKSSDTDENAIALAKMLNNSRDAWRDKTLVQRAEICVGIAKNAKEKTLTSGELASAVTKLMWFLHPEEWTLFDSRAADGIRIKKSSSIKRMRCFYKKLHDQNFSEINHNIKEILRASSMAFLYSERVIDKFLMFKSSPPQRQERDDENAKIFMDLIPKESNQALTDIIEKLDSKIPDTIFSN